jgi:hypothetical protein
MSGVKRRSKKKGPPSVRAPVRSLIKVRKNGYFVVGAPFFLSDSAWACAWAASL